MKANKLLIFIVTYMFKLQPKMQFAYNNNNFIIEV